MEKSLEGTQDMSWQDKWLSDELWALLRVKRILTVEIVILLLQVDDFLTGDEELIEGALCRIRDERSRSLALLLRIRSMARIR